MLRRDVSPTTVSSMNRRREISVHEIDFCSHFQVAAALARKLELETPRLTLYVKPSVRYNLTFLSSFERRREDQVQGWMKKAPDEELGGASWGVRRLRVHRS